MKTYLNIGLDAPEHLPNMVPSGVKRLKVSLSYLCRYFKNVYFEIRTAPTGEPTLAVALDYWPDDHVLGELCLKLNQDCIAVVPPHYPPYLHGPYAAEYGEFDPSLFVYPSRKDLP